MPVIARKINIKIQGKVVSVDKYFLDILALARFCEKYEEKNIRKLVNSIVRELVKDEPEVSPQIVDQKIALSLLPKNKQVIMLTTER